MRGRKETVGMRRRWERKRARTGGVWGRTRNAHLVSAGGGARKVYGARDGKGGGAEFWIKSVRQFSQAGPLLFPRVILFSGVSVVRAPARSALRPGFCRIFRHARGGAGLRPRGIVIRRRTRRGISIVYTQLASRSAIFFFSSFLFGSPVRDQGGRLALPHLGRGYFVVRRALAA